MYQRTQPSCQLFLSVATNAMISKLIPASPIFVNAPILISVIFLMEMRSATISQA